MQLGALGDIHGAFETVEIIMKRHEDVPLWVCVGDVASNEGDYFTPAGARIRARCRAAGPDSAR